MDDMGVCFFVDEKYTKKLSKVASMKHRPTPGVKYSGYLEGHPS